MIFQWSQWFGCDAGDFRDGVSFEEKAKTSLSRLQHCSYSINFGVKAVTSNCTDSIKSNYHGYQCFTVSFSNWTITTADTAQCNVTGSQSKLIFLTKSDQLQIPLKECSQLWIYCNIIILSTPYLKKKHKNTD